MKTLVVGCDASGKTTLLDSIQAVWGDTVMESTRTKEATEFKIANHRRLIDGEYISQREALYLSLSHQALMAMKEHEGDVISSDSSLVTRLSHSAMRQVIHALFQDAEEVIAAWRHDEEEAGASTPDIFVFTHAGIDTIIGRMVERQRTDSLEHFWGFNSPVFLNTYQARWHETIQHLSRASQVCLALDTGKLSVEECLEQYEQTRNSLDA